MTVQFNLIPDIKSQYLKAKQLERLTIGGATVAAVICIIILALLFFLVDFKQKHDINNLTSNISTSSAKLRSITGLDKIITIQNQLETLPGLYQNDPKISRLFGYITQLTPPNVTIGDLSVDLTANTMDIKGSAPALSDVNAFTDALKRATYDDKTAGTTGAPAFSSVVLTSFGRDSQGATYTIDFSFDPVLFSASDQVTLNVPQTTNAPQVPGINGEIFKALTKPKQAGGQ